MGYWSKDGSYVYESEDGLSQNEKNKIDSIKRNEREEKKFEEYIQKINNERRNDKIASEKKYNQMTLEEREKENRKEEVRNYTSSLSSVERSRYYENNSNKIDEEYVINENKKIVNQKQNNYTHVPDFVKDPQSLSDRRARANYWARQNAFEILKGNLNGKLHKFDKLWDEFSKAKTDIEREKIIAQMEMLYPTTKNKLNNAEKFEANQNSRGR